MAQNEQAYTGQADIGDTTSEWNRLQFAIRSIVDKNATATLVMVKAVGSGTVDVQPMVAQTDGAGNAVAHGVVHALPVWQLQGGAAGVIVTPTAGDIGLAVFSHSDISAVKRNKAPSNPGSARKFDYSDGIYLGGVLNAPPTTFLQMDAAGVTLTAGAGLPMVINAPGGLTINAPTVVFTGDIETAAGSTLNGKSFDSHEHSGVQTGTGNSGPPV